MAVVHEIDHVHGDSGSGVAMIVGIILLLVVAFLFLYYGLPALRGGFGTPQVNVPGKIDVNVNNGQGK